MTKSILTIIILILTHRISAQDSLSLEQCIEIATEKNLQIFKQQNQEAIYHNNIKSAQDNRLPTISAYTNANASWGRGIDPFTNTYVNQQFNTYNGGLNANLNLFNGFYHINNIKLQKQNLAINQSEWESIKRSLVFDIGLRYTNIMYLSEMIENIKEQIKISQKNIEQTQIKIDAGTMPKREIYKAISQKESEELNLIQTENNLETNKLELIQILGRNPNDQIILKKLQPSTVVVSRQEILSTSLDNLPRIQVQKENLKRSELSLDIAKSGFYPTITLGGQLGSTYSSFNKFHSFQEQIDNNLSYGFNLNANIPIFNQWQTRNNVKKAELDIKTAKLNYEAELQTQYKELNKAYLDYATSIKKLEESKSALQTNKINFETDQLKYDAGKISLQELNITKSNLFQSISNWTRDTYEAYFNSMVMKIYQGK